MKVVVHITEEEIRILEEALGFKIGDDVEEAIKLLIAIVGGI